MTRSTVATTLAILATLAISTAPARAAEPDKAIKAQLDGQDIGYKVDKDGDFQILVELDGGRTQGAWVRSSVADFRSLKVREIWSPGFDLGDKPLPPKVATRLLGSSHDLILGGWTVQKRFAMLVVKVPASATPEQLSDAIFYCARMADQLEQEFTPGKDEL